MIMRFMVVVVTFFCSKQPTCVHISLLLWSRRFAINLLNYIHKFFVMFYAFLSFTHTHFAWVKGACVRILPYVCVCLHLCMRISWYADRINKVNTEMQKTVYQWTIVNFLSCLLLVHNACVIYPIDAFNTIFVYCMVRQMHSRFRGRFSFHEWIELQAKRMSDKKPVPNAYHAIFKHYFVALFFLFFFFLFYSQLCYRHTILNQYK